MLNERDFKLAMRLRGALRHTGKLLISTDPQIVMHLNIKLMALFSDIEYLDKLMADNFELSPPPGGGGGKRPA